MLSPKSIFNIKHVLLKFLKGIHGFQLPWLTSYIIRQISI